MLEDLFNISKVGNDTSEKLMLLNEKIMRYGIVLTQKQAELIASAEREHISETERIVFGEAASVGIVKKFARSSFADESDFAETAAELVGIFYTIKEETDDGIPDSELIEMMFDCFENMCGGSLEMLSGRGVEAICDAVRSGKELPESANDFSADFRWSDVYDD